MRNKQFMHNLRLTQPAHHRDRVTGRYIRPTSSLRGYVDWLVTASVLAASVFVYSQL